jgi:endonuclease/exonuclease/phosphatase family metal-dependent hydrolase
MVMLWHKLASVRIVSLNAWGGAVFETLRAWLPPIGCDVLCLQEVTRTPGLTGWTTFRDAERALPQRASLFDDVRRLLPGHQGWFDACPAETGLAGAGRERGDFTVLCGDFNLLPDSATFDCAPSSWISGQSGTNDAAPQARVTSLPDAVATCRNATSLC